MTFERELEREGPDDAEVVLAAEELPEGVKSGADASAYNPPAEDDPGEAHEPPED